MERSTPVIGRRPLAYAAAVSVATTATVALAATFVFGRRLAWTVDTLDGADGSVAPTDLRQELAWLTVLWIGVLIAAVLATRLRGNPVPWALAATGVGFIAFPAVAVSIAYAEVLGDTPSWAAAVGWAGNWVWLVGSAGGLYLLLLFPDGRYLSPRWRTFGRALAVYLGIVFVLVATYPELEAAPHIANPLALPVSEALVPVTHAVMPGFFLSQLAAVVSLVLRFIRSRGMERLQMKWMATAGVVYGSFLVAQNLWGAPRWLQAIPTLLLLAALVVAVTRYRLYEIDRLIRRGVSYALLTVVLAGVYVASIVALGSAARGLTGEANSDLVVAASTLAAAALFRPARRRVQRMVDRRFDRARYDAVRSVESFAIRLRGEVDLQTLESELAATVEATLRPERVVLWLPEGPSVVPGR